MAEEMNPLHELLVDELKDLYNAENQIIKALPRMAKKANNEQLRRAFETHLQETRGQAERLEQIAQEMDFSLRGKKCKAMEGLVEEAQDMMSEHDDPEVLDAGLIAAAQRVEHYEIAGYGTVKTFADHLDLGDAKSLLDKTLDQESKADKLLTQLAENSINVEAMQ